KILGPDLNSSQSKVMGPRPQRPPPAFFGPTGGVSPTRHRRSNVGCGATNRAMRRRPKLAEAAIAQLGAMMPDAFAGDAHALRFASRCSVRRAFRVTLQCPARDPKIHRLRAKLRSDR